MGAADEVGEGGVLDEPRQLTAVRSGHELHATLRYAARRQRLCLCANLILTSKKSSAQGRSQVLFPFAYPYSLLTESLAPLSK